MESPHENHTGPSTGARIATVAVLVALAGTATALLFTQRVVKRSSQTFTFAPPSQLAIDAEESDLTLVGAGVDGLEVVRTAKWSGPDEPRTPLLANGTLRLRGCGSPWWLRVASYGACSTGYRMTLPGDRSVLVAINVGDATVSGSFRALSMTADVGHLSLRGIDTAEVDARTNVGGIDLAMARVPDRIFLTTDVGGITLDLPAGRYAVRARTDVGSVSVDDALTDGSSPHIIDLTTGVGDITVREIR